MPSYFSNAFSYVKNSIGSLLKYPKEALHEIIRKKFIAILSEYLRFEKASEDTNNQFSNVEISQNITIKDKILEYIPLPLKIAQGTIGKISLKLGFVDNTWFPSLSLSIKDLYLHLKILSPNGDEFLQLSQKKSHINPLESTDAKLNLPEPKSDLNGNSKTETKGESWLDSLRKNFTINIENIYVKFSDDLAGERNVNDFSIALVLTMESLFIKNEPPLAGQNTNVSSFIKKMQLTNLALAFEYIDFSDMNTSSEYKETYNMFGPLNFTITMNENYVNPLNHIRTDYQFNCEIAMLSIELCLKHYQLLILESERLVKLNSEIKNRENDNLFDNYKLETKLRQKELSAYHSISKANSDDPNIIDLYKSDANNTPNGEVLTDEENPNSNDIFFKWDVIFQTLEINLLNEISPKDILLSIRLDKIHSNIELKTVADKSLKIYNSLSGFNICGQMNSSKKFNIFRIYFDTGDRFTLNERTSLTQQSIQNGNSIEFNIQITYPNDICTTHVYLKIEKLAINFEYIFIQYFLSKIKESSLAIINLFGNFASKQIKKIQGFASEYMNSESPPVIYNICIKDPCIFINTLTNISLFIIFDEIKYETIIQAVEIIDISSNIIKENILQNIFSLTSIQLGVKSLEDYLAYDDSTLRENIKIQMSKILKPLDLECYIYRSLTNSFDTLTEYFLFIQTTEISIRISVDQMIQIKYLADEWIDLVNIFIGKELSSNGTKKEINDNPEKSIDKCTIGIDQIDTMNTSNLNEFQIFLRLYKFSFEIQWGAIVQEDELTSHFYRPDSSLSFSLNNSNVQYINKPLSSVLICNIKESLFLHTFDISTYCIFQIYSSHIPSIKLEEKKSIFEVDQSISMANISSIIREENTEINISFIKLYLHYRSMQSIFDILQIMYLLKDEYHLPSGQNSEVNIKKCKDLTSSYCFKVARVDCTILYDRISLFHSYATKMAINAKLIIDETLGINFEMSDLYINDKCKNNTYYSNIFVANSKENIRFSIEYFYPRNTAKESQKNYIFIKAKFSKIIFVFLQKFINDLTIWVAGTQGQSTAIKELKKITRESTDSILCPEDDLTGKIVLEFENSDIIIPNLSTSDMACYLTVKSLIMETYFTFSIVDQNFKINLKFIETSFSRRYILNKEDEINEMFKIPNFTIDLNYIIKSENHNYTNISTNCQVESIYGEITVIDIMFLKSFFIENISEESVIVAEKKLKDADNPIISYPLAIPNLFKINSEISKTPSIVLRVNNNVLGKSANYLILKTNNELSSYIHETKSNGKFSNLFKVEWKKLRVSFNTSENKITADITIENISIQSLATKKFSVSEIFIGEKIKLDYSNQIYTINIDEFTNSIEIHLFKYFYDIVYSDINSISFTPEIVSEPSQKTKKNSEELIEFINQPIISGQGFQVNLVLNNFIVKFNTCDKIHCLLCLKTDLTILKFYYLGSRNSTFNINSKILQLEYIFDREYCINENDKLKELFHLQEFQFSLKTDFDAIKSVTINIHRSLITFSQDSYLIMNSFKNILNTATFTRDDHSSNSQLSLITSINNLSKVDDITKSVDNLSCRRDYNFFALKQKVLARTDIGEYYFACIENKTNYNFTVKFDESNSYRTYSIDDCLGIISLCYKGSVLINNIILIPVKSGEKISYRLAIVISVKDSIPSSNGKCQGGRARFFYNYSEIEFDSSMNYYLIPSDIYNPFYRGVGDYLFCRYNDGIYYLAMVKNRIKNTIIYCLFKDGEEIIDYISHKISDDSSYAFFYNSFSPNDITTSVNQQFLAISMKDKCVQGHITYKTSNVSKIYFFGNGITQIISYIRIAPQKFGYKGIGYRYFYLDDVFKKVYHIVCYSYRKHNNVYHIANSDVIMAVDKYKLFIDVIPTKDMLYYNQFVIVLLYGNDEKTFIYGHVQSITNLPSYNDIFVDVKLSNSNIIKASISLIRICEKDLLNKSYYKTPLDLFMPKASLKIANFTINLNAKINNLSKPILIIKSKIEASLFPCLKEKFIYILFDLGILYFNFNSTSWEPLLNFDDNTANDNTTNDNTANDNTTNDNTANDKSPTDIKIYSTKVAVNSSNDARLISSQPISPESFFNFDLVVQKTLRITITERTLGTIYYFYLSLFNSAKDLKAPISDRTFSLSNDGSYVRKFRIFNQLNETVKIQPGNYFKCEIQDVSPNSTIDLNQVLTEDLIELKEYTQKTVPFIFLGLDKFENKVIVFLNRDKSVFLSFSESKFSTKKHIIVDVFFGHDSKNIYIRNLLKINNHVDYEIEAGIIIGPENTGLIHLNQNQSGSIFLPSNAQNFKFLFAIKSCDASVVFSKINVETSNIPYNRLISAKYTNGFGVIGNKFINACFSVDSRVIVPSFVKSDIIFPPMVVDIYPSLSIKNDISQDIAISLSNEFNLEETVSIKSSKEEQIFDISYLEKKQNIYIKIFDVIYSVLVSGSISMAQFLSNSEVKVSFYDLSTSASPPKYNLILNCEKYPNRLRLYSPYYVINKTNKTIKMIPSEKNNTSYLFDPKSIFPFCPSLKCDKAKICINNSKESDEEFLLNVIGTNTYMSCEAKNKQYYYITISVQQSEFTGTLNIEINFSIIFQNELENPIKLSLINAIDQNYLSINSLEKRELDIPIPAIPCEFQLIQECFSDLIRLFSLSLNKNQIIYSLKHDNPIEICYQVEGTYKLVKFCIVNDNSYDGVFYNKTDFVINFYDDKFITKISKNESYFFNMIIDEKGIIHNKISFDNLPPTFLVCLPALSEKTKSIDQYNLNVVISSCQDAYHRIFLLLPEYEDEDETQEDIQPVKPHFILNLRLKSIEFSIVNSLASKELAIVSVISNKNLWVYVDERTNLEQKFTESWYIEMAYIAYKCGKIGENYVLKNQNILNFRKKVLNDDKSLKIYVKRHKFYGFQAEIKIDSFYNIQNVLAKIFKIHVDNPSIISPNRIILRPIPLPRSSGIKPFEKYKEFLGLNICLLNSKKNGGNNEVDFTYIDNLKLLIQEFNLNLDLAFILTMAGFLDSIYNYTDFSSYVNEFNTISINSGLENKQPNSRLFKIKYISFSPLKFNLGFMSNSFKDRKVETDIYKKEPSGYFYSFIIGFFSLIPVLNFKDIQFKIPCLEINNQIKVSDLASIQKYAINHYISELKRQSYSIVFGLNILGNPKAFTSKFMFGVKDFFFEPVRGSIMSEDYFELMSAGMQSLIHGTVGNAANVVANVTDSIGYSLAALSLDAKHQINRNLIKNSDSYSAVETLASSSLGILKGITSGFTGVLLSPIDAFTESREPVNVLKGFGKGFMGLITKPAGGIVDFVSNSFNLISKKADLNDAEHFLRNERCFDYTKILSKYSETDSKNYNIFNILLYTIVKTSLLDYMFVGCYYLTDSILLLTDTTILKIFQESFLNEKDSEIYFYYLIELMTICDNKTIQIKFRKPSTMLSIILKPVDQKDLPVLFEKIKMFTNL